MAACTQYFEAWDENENYPRDVDPGFEIKKWDGSSWVSVGSYSIPSYPFSIYLIEGMRYKVYPTSGPSGWTTPDDVEFTACRRDIVLIWERICPDPTVSIPTVSNYNPESGEVVNFTGYASGGTGHSIVSRKWDFGDGTSSTLSNPSKSWKNTTDSPIIYTVRFTATNDCRKSDSTSTTITVASEVVKTGIEIQFPSSLNGKQLIAHGAISTVLGMWWTGPAVHGGLWTKGRCTWDNIDSSKKYVIQTGDACETSLPRELPDVCAGTFANGDDVVILVRNPGFDFRVYGSGNVHTLSGTSFNVLYLDETSGDIITTAFTGKVCGWLGIPSGTECDAFWAEFYDPIFVANYMSIQATGEDMFGNARTLSWIDHVAFVASLVGSLPVFNLFPFAGVVKRLGDAGAVIIKKARDLPSTDLAIAMDAFWDICEYSPDAVRNMAQKIIDDFNNLMVENDDAFFTFHDKFTDYASRLYHDHYPVDVAKDAVESFRTLFEAAPEYIKRMWFQSVPIGVHNPAEDIYNTFVKFLGKTEADAMWGKIFKYLPDFVENWIFKIDEFIDGYQDITKTDIKDFLDEVKRGPEAPLAILESIEDVPAAGITTFSDFMAKLLDDGGSKVILHDFFGKYADEFVAIKNAQGEAAAHAWAINLADESLRTLNTDIIIRNFYDGTTALVKTDIDEVVDLTPEQFQLLLKSWESSGDLPALITKLDDGTEKQVLGNVFTLVDGYYDVVSGAVGKTQADEWVGKNLDISSEAMKAADPAKMADIPKSGQDYAHKAHTIAGDIEVDEDLVFNRRTLADDVVETTDNFVGKTTDTWNILSRTYVGGKFSNLATAIKTMSRREKFMSAWFFWELMSFVVGFMVLKAFGIFPGDRSFRAFQRCEAMSTAFFTCKSTCENALWDGLADAITEYENAIKISEEYLIDNEAALKREHSYGTLESGIATANISIELWRSCLANHGLHLDAPHAKVVFTSNVVCMAYVDDRAIDTVFAGGLPVDIRVGKRTLEMKASGYTGCVETVTLVEGVQHTFHCDLQLPTCVLPVPKITAPITAKAKESIQFKGSATTESTITRWYWDFGSGEESYIQNPSCIYWNPGTYLVQLFVTDDCGTVTTTHTIVIEEEAPTPPTPTPGEESGTLLVMQPIDSTTDSACKRAWEAEIYVDGQTIGKTAQFSIPFGTDKYMSGWGGQCGTHDIKLVLAGYQDVEWSWTINDGDSETWQPHMDPVGYIPPVGHPIDFYIPENASLTVTPITTVSRIVAGMKRIGGR